MQASDLAAVTRTVDAADFSDAAFQRNASDPGWIARNVLAHESVLESLLDAGWTVVPFRFGTLYAERKDVERFLTERKDDLASALDFVEGRVELGVRSTLDLEQTGERRAAKLVGDDDAPGAGAAYLRRRGAELQTEAEGHGEAVGRAREIHAELSRNAVAATLNRPPAPERDRQVPLLNAAYLVEREAEPEFRALASRIADDVSSSAIRLDVTGPWPPYNFVSVRSENLDGE